MKYQGFFITLDKMHSFPQLETGDRFSCNRDFRCRGVDLMARILTIATSVVVLYLLYFLANRSCACPSSQDNALSLEGVKGRHSSRELQSITTDPSLPRLSGVNKELPSCVSGEGIAKSFLVIFMGHSGSSAIISELGSHSRVLIERSEPIDHFQYESNTTLALKYTRDLFSRGIREGKVAGFKMRPWHIGQQPEAWAALAKKFNTRIIWQYRKNILKQAVGEYSKKYYDDKSSVEGLRNQEEVKNRCNTGAGCRFKVEDFDFFHETLKDCLHSDLAIARGVNLILDGGKCVFDLPYEDYLYHREDTMRVLQRFLGLEYKETAPKRFKATSDSLCEVIENWDEVCEKFYGCHVWRHMFDDAHNGCSCDFSSGSTTYCDTVYKG